MNKIITLTVNPSVDMNAEIDHVVAERKLRCRNPVREPGGGGLNVSRALNNMEAASSAIYPAGGEMGNLLSSLLDKEDIDHYPVSIGGETRENINIQEKRTGRQFRFVMPGPELHEKEWRECIDTVRRMEPSGALVVASGSLPPGVPGDFYAILARAVKEAEGRLILDAPGEELDAALEEGVFLIKPNRREFRHLASREIDSARDQKEAAGEIVKKGMAEIVVVSLGAAGAVAATASGSFRYHSPPVPLESKVGAGDSMMAGIVYGLSNDYRTEDAVRLGIAAGAAAVMTPGTELCRGKDVFRIYEKMK
ncbi:MAG: 1-phosphofructokinase family hexose kinase [Candidatus Krumholzibacteriales bacterium]